MASQDTHVSVFSGMRVLVVGRLAEVMPAIKDAHDHNEPLQVLDDATARPIDLDLRGDVTTCLARLPTAPARGRGRPKLGVTAREVTLLPRHWDWLAGQPGGASVALRKLVEAAMRSPVAERRLAQEVTYRFMSAIAGDLPGFEEATRALFAADRDKFQTQIQDWPPDVRDYALRLAASAFQT